MLYIYLIACVCPCNYALVHAIFCSSSVDTVGSTQLIPYAEYASNQATEFFISFSEKMVYARSNWLFLLLIIFAHLQLEKCVSFLVTAVVQREFFILFLDSNFKDLSAFDTFQTQTQKKEVDFEEIFPHAIDTCKIKERASDLDVENVVSNFLPTTMTEKCFVACWLETFGVIVNRRFDRDQYIKLSTYGQSTDEYTKNILKKILQGCKLHNTCKQNR